MWSLYKQCSDTTVYSGPTFRKKVWEHQKWVWYNESKKVSGSLDEGYNCYINRLLTDFAI